VTLTLAMPLNPRQLAQLAARKLADRGSLLEGGLEIFRDLNLWLARSFRQGP